MHRDFFLDELSGILIVIIIVRNRIFRHICYGSGNSFRGLGTCGNIRACIITQSGIIATAGHIACGRRAPGS